MKTITISFCDNCGAQLPTNKGSEENPNLCNNCGAPVAQRNQRLEGTFSIPDGNRMLVLFGDDPIED